MILSKPKKAKALEYEWVERIEEHAALDLASDQNDYEGDWD
jgi:hypothetical protein